VANLDKDIILGIADDLDANADLPPHVTIRGRRPLAIQPTDCPVLVVWLDHKVAVPRTSIRYDADYTIGVSWHEATVEEVESLVRDEDIGWSLAENRGKIEARLRALSRSSPVASAWEMKPGESTYIGPLPQQGMVHGFTVEAIVSVTEE
jgi:hypothetical protein